MKRKLPKQTRNFPPFSRVFVCLFERFDFASLLCWAWKVENNICFALFLEIRRNNRYCVPIQPPFPERFSSFRFPFLGLRLRMVRLLLEPGQPVLVLVVNGNGAVNGLNF